MKSGHDLGDALRQQKKHVKQYVDSVGRDLLSESNEEALIDEVVEKFIVHPLAVDRESMTRDETEIEFDITTRPDAYFPDSHRAGPIFVPGLRLVIHLPFSGDADLWDLTPNASSSTYPHGNVRASTSKSGGRIEFIIEGRSDDPPERFKGLLDPQLDDIDRYIGWQRKDADEFNASLSSFVSQVIQQRRERTAKQDGIGASLGIPRASRKAPEPPSREPRTKRTRAAARREPAPSEPKQWDVFVCHASEDKAEIARPLAEALQAEGLNVWYDEFSMTVGDSLRRKINEGIARSRFGVVVLSPTFFSKEWPQNELDGLTALEVEGRKVILPVWHEIERVGVAEFSPILADRLAASTDEGLDVLVAKLLRAIEG